MGLNNEELEMSVRSIIAEALKVDESIITSDLSIGDIPEWNSMGNLAIMAALEEKMEVEIPMEDLFDMTSVQSIIGEIKKLKK